MKITESTRRKVLTQSLAGISMAGLPLWYAKEVEAAETERVANLPGCIAPNDTMQIACIGSGGRKGGFRQGLGDTRGISRQMGVKVLAIADVDQDHANEAAAGFGPDCKAYYDFREVLARPDIDAVVIGTPDHWHAIIAIAAMRAGKDVYCEKPLTLTIHEGRRISDVQRETGRIFQVGSQQRSDGRFRLACEIVRSGLLGKIKRVEAHLPNGTKGGPFATAPVPAGFNWDMWLGPAPMVDYIPQRTHGNFRHWYDYSGGMMTDWGAHHLDITQWALGMDHTGPVKIESKGVLPDVPNGYNCACDFEVHYTYANGVEVVAMCQGENGVKFEGEKGWLFVSRGRIEASDEKLLSEPLPRGSVKLYTSNSHQANFVDCVRDGRQPICTAEIGHRSATVCHLGNISLRLGGKSLEWDPLHEKFKGSDDANRLANKSIRGDWKL